MIRVLIADDHRIVREGVRRILGDSPDMRIVAEATTGAETLRALEAHPVDVLVLDVAMPQTSFTKLLQDVRSNHPSVRVVVLSAHTEQEYAVRALRGGASGYVTKERSTEDLAEAIRMASTGRRYISASVAELLAADLAGDADRPAHAELSDRELEVLRLLGTGKSVKQIAAGLGLSVKTVSTYRMRLLEKLHLKSTAELIRFALQQNLA